ATWNGCRRESRSATIASSRQYRYPSTTLRRSPCSRSSGSRRSSSGHSWGPPGHGPTPTASTCSSCIRGASLIPALWSMCEAASPAASRPRLHPQPTGLSAPDRERLGRARLLDDLLRAQVGDLDLVLADLEPGQGHGELALVL